MILIYIMGLGDIHIFTEANCHYGIINKKLSIYNRTITDIILTIKQIDKYLLLKESVYETLSLHMFICSLNLK